MAPHEREDLPQVGRLLRIGGLVPGEDGEEVHEPVF
jgi:hypothetical protein